MELRSRVPAGPLEQKRDVHRRQLKLVNPAEKRKLRMNVAGPSRLVSCRFACRDRLQRWLLVHPGQPSPGTLDPGAPRHECSLSRARAVVGRMDAEGFGGCANTSDCQAACPKESSVDLISEMNAGYFRAVLKGA